MSVYFHYLKYLTITLQISSTGALVGVLKYILSAYSRTTLSIQKGNRLRSEEIQNVERILIFTDRSYNQLNDYKKR